MAKRLVSVLLMVGALVLYGAAPGLGAEQGPTDPEAAQQGQEGEEAAPELEAICAEGAASAEFCPEPYEEPSFFQWFEGTLLVVGLIMAAALLLAYLFLQPRFAEERKARRSR